MIVQSQAKIFLSDEHGLIETTSFRNRTLFNYESQYSQQREPFEHFYLLNDYTLDGGASVQVHFSEDAFVLLLPVVGAVQYCNEKQKEQVVIAGQSMMLVKKAGENIELVNVFEEELVNVVVLAFKTSDDHWSHPRWPTQLNHRCRQLAGRRSWLTRPRFNGKHESSCRTF